MHMSPDSANLVMSSGNIAPTVVQSQVTVINDQDKGTYDDKDGILFKTADPFEQLPNLKLFLNNNLTVSTCTYSHLPTPEADKDFLVTHHSPRLDITMDSEYDLTQGSTPASSVPSRPISPTTYLLEVLQHITANQSLARKPAPQNGSNGSISMLKGIDLSQYNSAFTRLQQETEEISVWREANYLSQVQCATYGGYSKMALPKYQICCIPFWKQPKSAIN